jgi:hypothetical protein
MRGFILILLAGGLLSFAACKTTDVSAPTGKAWMATEPIQCLGNSWERDWLESHDGDYGSYPRDREAQGEIIKEYFVRQGVDVFDITTRQKYDIVCTACSCPEGHTLYILVGKDDTEIMAEFGFRVEPPRI